MAFSRACLHSNKLLTSRSGWSRWANTIFSSSLYSCATILGIWNQSLSLHYLYMDDCQRNYCGGLDFVNLTIFEAHVKIRYLSASRGIPSCALLDMNILTRILPSPAILQYIQLSSDLNRVLPSNWSLQNEL